MDTESNRELRAILQLTYHIRYLIIIFHPFFFSVQFSSVAHSCLNLCDPMDCSMPGFPVHQQLPRVCSNSYPLSRWCYPTISFSLFTDCWWTANNLTRERNLCQGQVSKFLVIFKEAHSVRIWNLIETVGKQKHFSSSVAERVKCRPGAVGGHWQLCGKNLLQSNQQKKMLMQK